MTTPSIILYNQENSKYTDKRGEEVATLADKDKIYEILLENPDGIDLGDIAEQLGKTKPTASALLSRLVSEGKAVNIDRSIWGAIANTPQSSGKSKAQEHDPSSVMREEVQEPPPVIPLPGEYEKFTQIGRSLGLREDFLKIAVDHVFQRNTNDLSKVWDALNGLYLRPDVTRRWFNIWADVINQPIPVGIVAQVMPGTTETAKDAESKLPTKFSIIGDELVPDPDGDFTFSQGRQLLMTKAVQGAVPGAGAEKISDIINVLTPFIESQRTAKVEEIAQQGETSILAILVKSLIEQRGGGQQPLTLNDMLSVVDKIEEVRRSAAPRAPQPDAVSELERMASLFSTLKGVFGNNDNHQYMVPVKGANGEASAMPIEMFFKIEDHKRQVKREDEEFEGKQEMGKRIRSVLDSVAKAADKAGR